MNWVQKKKSNGSQQFKQIKMELNRTKNETNQKQNENININQIKWISQDFVLSAEIKSNSEN